MPTDAAIDKAKAVLRGTFGYGEFRSVQERVIGRALDGGNSLVLMPTGGGKSLCYQIPALVRDGVGIVVSPLISLMQDQVGALRAKGVEASAISSAMSASEATAAEHGVISGRIKLAYVSPERLATPRFMDILDRANISLFALDEAHCASQWGHDFRPDYLGVGCIAERFPGVPRMALTATASPETRDDIIGRFRLEGSPVFSTSFDRPNITYRVGTASQRERQIAAFLGRHEGECGIVYCPSRARVEAAAAELTAAGLDVVRYHAGMGSAERAAAQARFLGGQGVIACATIAFGMGIDKADVRFVIHDGLPGSIEAYYQETGRAGRDGLPAEALMLWSGEDANGRRRLIQTSDGGPGRRAAEAARLNALLGLCETSGCRRTALLAHFGEGHSGNCTGCDRCLDSTLTWDATLHVQKAVSAALRTGERFGAAHLTDVLLGKRTGKVLRFGHDQIRTFGAGADLDAGRWRSLLRQVTSDGYLEPDPEAHGALRVTAKGREAIRPGARRIRLVFDAEAVGGNVRAADIRLANTLGDGGNRTFDALRGVRGQIAAGRGVPPQSVFSDAVLIAIARRAPRSADELLEVPGVSALRARSFGEAILAAVAATADPAPEAEIPAGMEGRR
jgi:ATP-dependent DNA helicase RecQ